MYVKRVILENIRPFQSLDLDFERPDGSYAGWNVVAGDNASGKSTLLRAIAVALAGPNTGRVLAESFAGWLRRGESEGLIAVELQPARTDLFAGGGRRPKSTFWAELRLVRRGGDVDVEAGSRHARGAGTGTASRGPWASDQGEWFAAAYGPFRRLFGTSSDAQRLMTRPGRAPRFATLFKEDATLGEAPLWLQELKFKVLEGRKEEETLLGGVLALMNDEFLQQGFRVSGVDSDGLQLTNAAGMSLRLAEMSDGYRSALALLIDIVRHMSTTFSVGDLVAEQTGGRVIPHPGVVLIDEVDSHLHPSWQRLIGDWLKTRFPELQFITTSHSPFVVQSTDPGGLYRLPDPAGNFAALRVPEDERLRLVRQTTDEILTSGTFGLEHTRSPAAVEERRQFSRLKSRVRQGGALTPKEQDDLQQMSLFIREE